MPRSVVLRLGSPLISDPALADIMFVTSFLLDWHGGERDVKRCCSQSKKVPERGAEPPSLTSVESTPQPRSCHHASQGKDLRRPVPSYPEGYFLRRKADPEGPAE